MSASEKEMLTRLLGAMRHEIDELRQQVNELRQQPVAPVINTPVYPASYEQPADPQQIRITTAGHEDYSQAEEWHEDEARSLEDIERIKITQTLVTHHGSRKLAAVELGISERTLYRKIKSYGL